jgi:niacin transporter
MKQHNKVLTMTIAAMLCAIGIVIPYVAPRIVMEPISFTLASHVPIFIAMFISPPIAIAVSLITSLGFFIAGFPLTIVIRAITHILFATIGAFILKKNGNVLLSVKSASVFSLVISLIHAIAEVTAITLYYWGTNAINDTYFTMVIIGIGLGTVIHSMLDFGIAVFVWKPLQHIVTIPASARIRAK